MHNSREIVIHRRLRVQWLTPMLLRIETARPDGSFLDGPSLTVQRRRFTGVETTVRETHGSAEVAAAGYTLVVAEDPAGDFAGYRLRLLDADREVVWSSAPRTTEPFAWPRAGRLGRAWTFEDYPRAAPPDAWDSAAAWQIDDNVRDLYLFLCEGSRDRLRAAFLDLTGPIPMPPLWTLGFWTSRYYPYSEETALNIIDRYREASVSAPAAATRSTRRFSPTWRAFFNAPTPRGSVSFSTITPNRKACNLSTRNCIATVPRT